MFRDDTPFYAAGIAFHSLFSIFALLFLFAILLGLFGQDPENLDQLVRFTAGMVPARAQEFVNQVVVLVHRPVPQKLIPVALAMTLWTSSNVVQAVIHALARIYHTEESRPAWKSRLIALAVVGSSSLLIVIAFVLLVFGGEISSGLVEVNRFRITVLALLLAAKEPISILAVLVGAQIIYWLAPNFRLTHRVSLPGALVFTVAWILATIGFNIYLREWAVYDKVYGPLATVVVTLVWVYLSANLALFGGEVNAAVHRLHEDLTAAEGDA